MGDENIDQTVLFKLLNVLVPKEMPSSGQEIAIMNLFAHQKTDGIYLFESSEIKEQLQMFQPASFNDLVLLAALNKVNGAVLFDQILQNKNNGYDDFPYGSLLNSTYGVMLYEDQYIEALKLSADLDEQVIAEMRDAMQQRKSNELAALIHVFAEGCTHNSDFRQDGNFAQALVRQVWFELIEQSSFLVNRQQIINQVQISWKLAWLKLQHPALFEELLSRQRGEMG
ncbi:MAG: hypothetical protein PF489_07175 [Salinivirgaceae bacterium]|jgi:DNA polymerase-3 subunit alpha|nr:hypothetical protein [Salinivirgaceae bacterium]